MKKKVALIILTVIFILSFYVVLVSCDNSDGGGTNPPSGPSEGPGTSPGEDNPGGGNQEPGGGGNAGPTEKQGIIGIVGVLDAYDAEDVDKTYIRVDVEEKTDTTVYIIADVELSGISAKISNKTNGSELNVSFSGQSYDEERGIYYATFTAPNVAGNEIYEVAIKLNGEDAKTVYVQVLAKKNMDNNGWT